MTFQSIIKKNFFYHFKQYAAFFLCISFSIMVFFMYAILFYNSDLKEAIQYSPIGTMMKLVLFLITVFSLFFINYAHQAFIKSKYHEIGLFITLGMTYKEVKKMVRLEYLMLMTISMVSGIVTGLIFSKLFFVVFISITNFKNIPFLLNYKSFLLTIFIFLIIFLFVFIRTNFVINKLQITELLKKASVHEKMKYTHALLGFIGILLVVMSYVSLNIVLVHNLTDHPVVTFIIILLLGIIGLYLTISHFGYMVLKLVKKQKYQKNLLFYTELKHHYKQFRNILFITTLLIGIAFYFIGLTFAVYLTQKDEVETYYPYDLMLLETKYVTPLTDDELATIFNKHDVKIKEEKTMEFVELLLYKTTNREYSLWGSTVIVSNEIYENISGKEIDVNKGSGIAISFEDGLIDWYEKEEGIELKNQSTNETYRFTFQKEQKEFLFNFSNHISPFVIVLHHTDYEAIINNMDKKDINSFKLYTFDNWIKSKPLVEDITDSLIAKNPTQTNNKPLQQMYREWDYMPSSRILEYEHNIQNASFNFFVMCSIGIIFSISIGVVLYLKLFSDLPYQKKRYLKIRRIGLKDDELVKPIISELRIIFFIPLSLGLLLGFLFALITAVNFTFYEKVMVYCLFIMLIFIFIHMIFYQITKRQYIKQIVEGTYGN